MKHSVLIVEDEPDLLDLLKEELADTYHVEEARTANEAVQKVTKSAMDLVLLDLNMPDRNGIDLCREFRQSVHTRNLPIFILTGQTDEATQLSCFDSGADDFISKPFSFPLLKARIASRLKNSAIASGEVVRCGNLEIQKLAKMVTVSNKAVRFSSVEFRLLQYFVENPFRVVPRDEILKNIWGTSEVTSRTIDAHLVSIRKALTNFDHEIVSLYGEGYSLRRKGSGKR